MWNRFVALAGLPTMAALLLCTIVPADAQTPKPKIYNPPRMSDGHPDLHLDVPASLSTVAVIPREYNADGTRPHSLC